MADPLRMPTSLLSTTKSINSSTNSMARQVIPELDDVVRGASPYANPGADAPDVVDEFFTQASAVPAHGREHVPDVHLEIPLSAERQDPFPGLLQGDLAPLHLVPRMVAVDGVAAEDDVGDLLVCCAESLRISADGMERRVGEDPAEVEQHGLESCEHPCVSSARRRIDS